MIELGEEDTLVEEFNSRYASRLPILFLTQ